jgi:hypothetical protein
MPSVSTIRLWRREDNDISAIFEFAYQDQADLFADEVLAVARSALGLPSEGVQAAKLLCDALKWRAGQQAPKRWGTRQQVDMSGSMEMDVRKMTDNELRIELAKLLPEMHLLLEQTAAH